MKDSVASEPPAHARLARIDPLAELRALAAAALARRARARRDYQACRTQALGALRLAAGRELGAVVDFEPSVQGLGGFFAGVAVTASGRLFVKCVLAGGREAAFWDAWGRGAVRAAGAHYRVLTPVAILSGRVATCLAFPELAGLDQDRRRRLGRYRRHLLAVARAMADFNSEHPLVGDPPFRPAPAGEAPRLPGRKEVEKALKVDAARAGDIVAALRRIERGWGEVRDRVERGPRCLAHMDLGPGNIAFDGAGCVLLDFGAAGAAAVGADLHSLLRYGGRSRPADDALVATYAAIFEGKGTAVDRDAARLAMRAHFAARYRNLRFAGARNLGTFGAATAMSDALLGLAAERT